MADHCYGCGVSLHLDEFKGDADDFCKYCLDDQGRLKPRDVVQKNIAHWMKSWQPGVDDAEAMRRAEIYMQAMPAWIDPRQSSVPSHSVD